jgi:hypothetical protein
MTGKLKKTSPGWKIKEYSGPMMHGKSKTDGSI